MVNIQPIEKTRLYDGSLEVHSVFRTIQGEGPYTGHPAVFVRLAGCNLKCPLCDTDYTSSRKLVPVQELVDRVAQFHRAEGMRPLVVITGGEPFRQNLTQFVVKLIDRGFRVQVETNGTLGMTELMEDLPPVLLTVVASPKAPKVHPSIYRRANAWKYVVRAGAVGTDGLPTSALDHSDGVARPPTWVPGDRIYLQPCDQQDEALNKANLQACIESAMQHGYVLQLQVHKIINME